MKIKTKKEMNLPELIEWGFNNPKEVESKIFESDNIDYFSNTAHVHFSNDGCGVKMGSSVTVNDTFTVEIEEQIDENTELTALVELSSRGLLGKTTLYRYHSINDVIDNQSVAFYILNDDQTMDLIWKNGKLVE